MDKEKINFSVFEHHHTVRSKLENLIEQGELSEEEAEEIYNNWLQKRREKRGE